MLRFVEPSTTLLPCASFSVYQALKAAWPPRSWRTGLPGVRSGFRAQPSVGLSEEDLRRGRRDLRAILRQLQVAGNRRAAPE
eukprot:3431911-Pyramimonas_sp.AAC.1